MPPPMGHGYVGDRRLHEAADSREMSSSEGNYEMRAVVQRVSQASVMVEEQIVGAIEQGLLVLLGVGVDVYKRQRWCRGAWKTR